MVLELKDKKRKTQEVITRKIGFRSVENKTGTTVSKRATYYLKRREYPRAQPRNGACGAQRADINRYKALEGE